MKIYALDKVFKVGTTYEAEHNKGFVIKKIGTNSTTDAIPRIDFKDLGVIIEDVTPKHKVETNLFGLLDLRDEYYVIPPEFSFTFTGESGKTFRCVGKLIILEHAEVFPADLMARFGAQHNVFRRYYKGEKALATDEVWKTDREETLFSLKLESHERLTLDAIVGAKIENVTPAEGDFGIRFYLDDIPLDILKKEMGQIGIDLYSMPLPPKSTTNMIPFSLEQFPIVVQPDHQIKITAINIGADLTPATGTAIKVTLMFIGKYEKFVV